MKKHILLTIILTFSLHVNAMKLSPNPPKKPFLKSLNLNFSWVEFGMIIPFKDKKINTLPFGMDKYLKSNKTGYSYSVPGLELWFNDKIGVEILFHSYYDFGYNKSEFDNYISNKYANYYIRNRWFDSFSLQGMAYRINYKFKLKNIQITPKFQIGINNLSTVNFTSSLNSSFKEKGSNHIIDYTIEKESLTKNIIDYHFILDISKKIDFGLPLEVGFKTELITVPTSFQYTITEKEYGSTPIENQLKIKQNHFAWSIGLVLRLILIK
jgi:hypothetical protein